MSLILRSTAYNALIIEKATCALLGGVFFFVFFLLGNLTGFLISAFPAGSKLLFRVGLRSLARSGDAPLRSCPSCGSADNEGVDGVVSHSWLSSVRGGLGGIGCLPLMSDWAQTTGELRRSILPPYKHGRPIASVSSGGAAMGHREGTPAQLCDGRVVARAGVPTSLGRL